MKHENRNPGAMRDGGRGNQDSGDPQDSGSRPKSNRVPRGTGHEPPRHSAPDAFISTWSVVRVFDERHVELVATAPSAAEARRIAARAAVADLRALQARAAGRRGLDEVEF